MEMSQSGAERRRWARIPGASLSDVSASIVSGPDVSLVNLSCGGALVQVAARYPVRSAIRLKLTRSTGEVTVAPGTVAWAEVASIVDGKIHYLVAIIFQQPIDMAVATGSQQPDEAVLSSPLSELSAAPDAANPAGGHALEAVLNAREAEHARALAEQQARYEVLLAELTTVANGQQAEYRQLLEQQAAAADQQRAAVERAVRELEAQLRAAEERCAAHETRLLALRREAETLVSLLTSPVKTDVSQHDRASTFTPPGASTHAVA